MTTTEHDLLTIDEVAEMCRAKVATVRFWRHTGYGPTSFRLGRRVVFRRTVVEAWIRVREDEQ